MRRRNSGSWARKNARNELELIITELRKQLAESATAHAETRRQLNTGAEAQQKIIKNASTQISELLDKLAKRHEENTKLLAENEKLERKLKDIGDIGKDALAIYNTAKERGETIKQLNETVEALKKQLNERNGQALAIFEIAKKKDKELVALKERITELETTLSSIEASVEKFSGNEEMMSIPGVKLLIVEIEKYLTDLRVTTLNPSDDKKVGSGSNTKHQPPENPPSSAVAKNPWNISVWEGLSVSEGRGLSSVGMKATETAPQEGTSPERRAS